MTLAWLLLFALMALVPLAWSLRRARAPLGRRDSALALHRGQLAELDRDLAEGRIAPAEHATATLEVQRRLLAAADAAEPAAVSRSSAPIAFAAVAIPIAAGALYLVHGQPGMPSQSHTPEAKVEQETRDAAEMIELLRARLAQLDQKSPQAREGYILLGNFEDSRGKLADAAKAWRRAVEIEFDPTLAAQAAEAQSVVDGHVGPDALALFRRALAAAPDNAPWRRLVEARLAEAARP